MKNRPKMTKLADRVLLRSACVFGRTASQLQMHWIFQGKKSERRKIEGGRVKRDVGV